MLRAVSDATVFISAVLRPTGPPGRLIKHFLVSASFEIVLSPAIVEETLRALTYPKLKRFFPSAIDPLSWFEDVAALADIVTETIEIPRLCEDADDDKYIAAAIDGRAAFVVTGDRKLLAVREHRGVLIVDPRAFLTILNR